MLPAWEPRLEEQGALWGVLPTGFHTARLLAFLPPRHGIHPRNLSCSEWLLRGQRLSLLWETKQFLHPGVSHHLLQLPKFKVHASKVKRMQVWVTQLCPTLCNPMNCSPPASSVHRILQARVLEWVAIPFSRGVFPTQGVNLGLLHFKQSVYHLSHGDMAGIAQRMQ